MKRWWLGLVACSLVLFSGGFAAADVASSATEIRPLLIGQKIPDAVLKDVKGQDVNLWDAMKGQQTVLIVYRGGWCYFCNRQLSQLRLIDSQLKALGYKVIAISPDPPKALRMSLADQELTFTLLSDQDYKVLEPMGVTFKATAKDFGAESLWKGAVARHKAAGGKGPFLLPVPGVFLVSKGHRIFFSYVNVDFTIRLSAEVLLTAAKVYAQE